MIFLSRGIQAHQTWYHVSGSAVWGIWVQLLLCGEYSLAAPKGREEICMWKRKKQNLKALPMAGVVEDYFQSQGTECFSAEGSEVSNPSS